MSRSERGPGPDRPRVSRSVILHESTAGLKATQQIQDTKDVVRELGAPARDVEENSLATGLEKHFRLYLLEN